MLDHRRDVRTDVTDIGQRSKVKGQRVQLVIGDHRRDVRTDVRDT